MALLCADTITMEEVLIEHVRRRPSIYDRSSTTYKNCKIREQEWKEVARAVNIPDVEAVKKRWRSLRDSFIKILRNLKNNPKQGVKWIYYKKLLFLLPHVESKELGSDPILKFDEDDIKVQDTSTTDNEIDNNTDFRFVPEDVSYTDNSQNSQTNTDFLKKRKSDCVHTTSNDEDPLMTPEQFYDSYVTKKIRSNEEEMVMSSVKEVDSDEQFLLSCLPALKRLAARENALARMRIQQVLFNVEFGADQQGSSNS